MAQETSLRVGADSKPLEQGVRRARGALKGLQTEAKRTESSFERLKKSVGGVGTLFAGIGVGLVVREFGQMLDATTNIDNRLRLVTKTGGELNAVFNELTKISNETRTGLQNNADLFNRLALSTKELGLTYREQLDLTRSLNQALVISGASAAEGGAGLIQLSQGLASGALRGDELRSVLENLPKVADVIAKGFGVTRGELRKLGEQGKITAKDVVEAFRKAAPDLAKEFEKITPTIEQSFTVFHNKALEFVRDLNKASGIGSIFSKAIIGLANNFNVLAAAAGGVAVVIGGIVVKAITRFTVALATNPVGLLIIALGALTTALGVFGDSSVEVAGVVGTGWEAIHAAIMTAWDFIKPVFEQWKAAFAAIGAQVNEFAKGFGTDLSGIVGFVKSWASIVLGVMGAVPKSIVVVFEDLPNGIEAVLKGAINKFLDFRRFVLDKIGAIPGAIARIFGQDKIADALDRTVGKLGSALDVPRLKLTKGAEQTRDKLAKIWEDAFRTDRLDGFGKAYQDNFKKIVEANKKAQASTDLLNNKLAEGSKAIQISEEIRKAREKLTKQIQSDFDKIREATGRAVQVTEEWGKKTREEIKKLGLENTKYAQQFEEIYLNRIQAARLKDVENSQAWAKGLTETQRTVAEGVRSQFETIRAARGENVAILNEWAEQERAQLKAVGLENSIFAEQVETIYNERLKEARRADLFAAKDAASGVRQAMVEYQESIGTAAEQTKKLFGDAFKGAEDALVEFVKTGKLDFRSLIDSMISDLIRLGIQQAITAALSSFGGGIGGGGGAGGIGGIIASAFMKEGGLTSAPGAMTMAPVDLFKKAPSMAVGGVTGGMPAILHENEAVIPLSKGREIPVKMQDAGKQGDTIINYNIQTPNADSFQRSQDQITARASRGLQRANRRNN